MQFFRKTQLQIQCWNVHGAFYNLDGDRYCKFSYDPEYVRHTSKYLLYGLVETHHTTEDVPLLQRQGYKCYQVCRKKLKRGRKSGGICVFVHESISRGVRKLNTAGSESIFIKLDKDFFCLDRDIVMSFSYCVPANSSYQTRTQFDPFEDLESKISNNSNNCDLICFGDFNARTASKPDYLVGDDNSDIPVMGELFTADTVATFPRGNLDKTTNSYGNRLLDLCQSVPLRICNGRVLGDVLGSYTCYTSNGQSTVDYCLTSPRIYDIIFSFVVNELLPNVSDHCSCTLTLQTKYLIEQPQTDSYVFIKKPKKVPWNESISVSFEGLVQTNKSKIFLSEFESRPMSCQNTVDSAVQSISGFLVGAAVQAAGPAPHTVRPNVTQRAEGRNWKFKKKVCQYKKPKWFDKTLESVQKQIRISSRLLRSQPGNSFLRGKLLSESKDFKRLRRLKKKSL